MGNDELEKLSFLEDYTSVADAALESLAMELSRPGNNAPGALKSVRKWTMILRAMREKRMQNFITVTPTDRA